MLHEIQVLTEDECSAVANTVKDLSAHWIRRHPQVPFYSLAAASYMDGYIYIRYKELAQKYNPLLRENFEWLYLRISDVLRSHLHGDVIMMPDFAFPGFHVFLGDAAFGRENFASSHFDLQYQLLKWPNPELADFNNPVSFTLAISLPACGAGLQMWDIEYFRQDQASDSQLISTIHQYRSGWMAVHSGHQKHQMAPMKGMKSGEDRITFQGHAILYDGSWVVYW